MEKAEGGRRVCAATAARTFEETLGQSTASSHCDGRRAVRRSARHEAPRPKVVLSCSAAPSVSLRPRARLAAPRACGSYANSRERASRAVPLAAPSAESEACSSRCCNPSSPCAFEPPAAVASPSLSLTLSSRRRVAPRASLLTKHATPAARDAAHAAAAAAAAAAGASSQVGSGLVEVRSRESLAVKTRAEAPGALGACVTAAVVAE
mmetsp:Transcript_27496/g.74086  ORF Transcript_27496/g.74086 Transcript_27496/m.74086 type:complete len:208 (+) Transcript_27496:118-741(+)